ncbi:uncharacterized protein LOC142330377 [Lycorma delicatula]|uniref:uncharacterized protein LOC142330377 n=1 Tax=Lycorma delicatula TaxID=130591 RepID=UPI003F50FB59
MCCSSSSGSLSRLGVFFGLVSFVTLLTAFVSNVWLFTREPVHLPAPQNHISTTITFKIGLWRVCPSLKRPNSSFHMPSPACSLIKYSTWDEVKHSDLGVWTPLEFTPTFISRMRLSTPFEAVSVVLMLFATMFALIGHCNADHKTLVACGLYTLGGLSLGGGLVIFASVLSDAYMDRPRRPLTAPGSSQLLFDYRYGWSFFAAGAAFIMAEFAALVSITAYLRRFPTVEDMVRVMVPGADRRLRAHHQQNEFLVRRQGGYTNKQDPQNKNKGETLIPSDLEGVDGPLLTSKTPPDICTTPGTNVPTGVELNCEEDILNINYRRSSAQHHHHNHLAGTTVPIKLMHQQCTGGGVTVGGIAGSKLASNYHNPHHHVHHQEYHQRYATIGSCTLVHQGMLGVSEGVPGTSSSSGSSASSGGMVTSTGSSISSKSFQHVPRQRKAITTTASSTTSSIVNKPNTVFTPLETLEHKSPTSVSSSQGYCSGSTV